MHATYFLFCTSVVLSHILFPPAANHLDRHIVMRTPQHGKLRNETKMKQASHEREDEPGDHIVLGEVCEHTASMEGVTPGPEHGDAQKNAKYFRLSQHDQRSSVEMQWKQDGGKHKV